MFFFFFFFSCFVFNFGEIEKTLESSCKTWTIFLRFSSRFIHSNIFLFSSVQIAFVRPSRIFLQLSESSEKPPRTKTQNRLFSKCFGECCWPVKLSIDQKDSEKIAIGTERHS